MLIGRLAQVRLKAEPAAFLIKFCENDETVFQLDGPPGCTRLLDDAFDARRAFAQLHEELGYLI
ncbi:hypothetical protein RA8CHR_03226 [Variovorax sp. RA8]|nr:hypothetical protein RA8CHR_03226 [Variovorax sp. RA8]